MINSREKGKKGEREVAKLLSDRGYKCRRGQQFNRTRWRRCCWTRLYAHRGKTSTKLKFI